MKRETLTGPVYYPGLVTVINSTLYFPFPFNDLPNEDKFLKMLNKYHSHLFSIKSPLI
ncbi:hypothetical protein [Xenorhabdus nematophila]|uniref:hypothetical protein n=1 Tax=Xenorhabdus nematophila TaxID=628 RepID=UPI001F354EE2|nr:hypothetical protein [Xenorhabdus nematophila]